MWGDGRLEIKNIKKKVRVNLTPPHVLTLILTQIFYSMGILSSDIFQVLKQMWIPACYYTGQ